MVDKDYGGEGGIKKGGRNWQRILLPIVGLIMIAAAGIVSAILARPVGIWLKSTVHITGLDAADNRAVQLAAGIGIFIILVLIYAAIFAALAPKPPKGISETELDKEKREKQQEEMRAKRRKREMKNKMRESRNKPQ